MLPSIDRELLLAGEYTPRNHTPLEYSCADLIDLAAAPASRLIRSLVIEGFKWFRGCDDAGWGCSRMNLSKRTSSGPRSPSWKSCR